MKHKIKLTTLYLLLGAGGLWHLLGLFQSAMAWLAGPLLIGLGVWTAWEWYHTLSENQRWRYIGWATFVIAGSFLLEWIGVKTGVVFGEYHYGTVLQPQVAGVPVAIGFAWLTVMLSSTAVVGRLRSGMRGWGLVIGGALFMVTFDVILELAAMKLGYWEWEGVLVPIRNYVAWFAGGLIFLSIGDLLKIFPSKIPKILMHMYFAQILYFGLALI
ncbi:MAG: carotenoid biosynthesis protein [Candidatus Marinimicrobia bacterium]|nr:carotenoid biosynthesis protein [Candidatus Neomarinimicrobiota bacterium]MCF7828585.1 carotenoid biosynthesis protein [Candidatus Neomarinimicrobiota bacterium]MCF7880326.1 carotenoid biosynthesis protein [Candidatus Neomarinimicrobiota bacterium]